MLDINQIPSNVIHDLLSRGHDHETIAQMTPAEAFDEYCSWHGLIGWGDTLRETIKALEEAEIAAEDNAK